MINPTASFQHQSPIKDGSVTMTYAVYHGPQAARLVTFARITVDADDLREWLSISDLKRMAIEQAAREYVP